MPQLMKLVWGGKLGKLESWSCSLHGLADDGAGPSVSTIAATITSAMTGANSGYSSAAEMDFVKLNFVTASDHYVTPDTPVTFDVIPATHGDSTPLPYQTAIVVTLLTAAPRGLAHAGRYYLPAGFYGGSPQTVDADGNMLEIVYTSVVAGQVAFLNALATAGFTPQVYSVKGATGRPVTGIKVGHVYDTQRRRRKSLLENYTVQSLGG